MQSQNPKALHKASAACKKAFRYHQEGKIQRAEAEYRKALKAVPTFFDALQGLGAIELQKEQYPQAIKRLEAAQEQSPPVAGLLCNLGTAYKSLGQLDMAERYFTQAAQTDPTFGPAFYNLALLQIDQQAYEAALVTLQEAERCRPGHLDTLLQLAYLQERLGHVVEALEYFKHALSMEPHNASILLSCGKLLQSSRQYEAATDLYRQAVDAEPENREALAKLADILEASNKKEEARDVIAKLLALDPQLDPKSHDLGRMILARIERRAKNLDQAKGILSQAPASTGPSDVQAGLQAELGLTLDLMGEYREAFEAFAKSNAIMHDLPETQAIDRQAALGHIQAYEQWLDNRTAHERDNTPSNTDKIPTPIFLVGFPRSGTTLTEQIISSSPDIASLDELPVLHDLALNISNLLGRPVDYPSVLDHLTDQDIQHLRKYYWERVQQAVPQDIAFFIDKMPLNIIHLGLIERLFPEAYIIVALRDPRDAVLSCFMQLFQPNEAMIQFLDLKQAANYYAATMNLWKKYRATTSLKWHESRYEDLVNDFDSATEKVMAFLGKSNEYCRNYYKQAGEKTISTPSYHDVATPIFQRAKGRWKHYESFMEGAMVILEPFVEEFAYQ